MMIGARQIESLDFLLHVLIEGSLPELLAGPYLVLLFIRSRSIRGFCFICRHCVRGWDMPGQSRQSRKKVIDIGKKDFVFKHDYTSGLSKGSKMSPISMFLKRY